MQSFRTFIYVCIVIALMVAGCGGLSGEPRIVVTFAPTPTALSATQVADLLTNPDLERGAAIFAQNCTACHGAGGRGDGRLVANGQMAGIPDFTNPAMLSVQTPQDYFTVITEGRLDKLMPPWGGALSEADRWAVTSYVYALRGESAPVEPAAADAPVPVEAVGSVGGTVRNGTAGASAPTDISIALQILNAEFQEVGFEMTQPAADGRFSFAGVPIRADYHYLVTALHDEQVFSSALQIGDPAAPALDLPVTIYERTTDPAVMEINLLVTRVERHQGDLLLTQIVSFRNTSDRAFISADASGAPQSVTLALPSGAVVLNEAELATCCALRNGVLVNLQPIIPGEDAMLRIVYSLPYNSGGTVLEYPLAYPVTNNLELLLPPNTFTVSEADFVAAGVQQFSTGVYEVYLAAGGAGSGAGAVVRYTLRDAGGVLGGENRAVIALLLAIAGGALMTSGVVGWLRLRRSA